jgi:hypothetical protein
MLSDRKQSISSNDPQERYGNLQPNPLLTNCKPELECNQVINA